MNRFWWGVGLLVASSVIGWGALFVGGALAIPYGRRAAEIGAWIYAASWIPFGLGGLLSGAEGIRYSKEFVRKWFRRKSGSGSL
ncbi:MAG: hypothetical protein A3G34_02615 [Candidatus Lindowbacteria bacterium RIFCSPLOWO2_12_FULL_62_27]|nr:MAG: hypothetical protein A3G34_02615 [Candidatus Lindowbacteria bacterium RIFCSPLOWO2_12_FULL_62_27]OGH62824.1 MAG: hypothetical protein A3I06_11130 [Candidatus Lindowbacteria bacterium RIFCSPLOWO2_02_FULL_62_12]